MKRGRLGNLIPFSFFILLFLLFSVVLSMPVNAIYAELPPQYIIECTENGGAGTCIFSYLATDDTNYEQFRVGDGAVLNRLNVSVNNTTIPSNAYIINATVCILAFRDSTLGDDAGDSCGIYAGENATGTPTYTTAVPKTQATCLNWSSTYGSPNAVCGDITAWLNSKPDPIASARKLIIVFDGTEQADKNVDLWIDYMYANITYTIPPQYSNVGSNTTTPYTNESILHYVYWTDNKDLSGYIFSSNYSGSWENDSFVPMTGTANWSNVTKNAPATSGVYGWRIYANNSNNLWNVTDIQIINVSNRPTTLEFSVNQSVYPQGRSPGYGYDVYIPFQVRYVDSTTNTTIPNATCYVTNNETSDNVTLTYNATTGNYTGEVNDYMMYDVVGFNATCSKTGYETASNTTSTNVWWFNYLWEWENVSYGVYNNYTTHWLRKEPSMGDVYTLTRSISTVVGENEFPEVFYFCGSGINCSFLKDYNMHGMQILRLNISINDTSCKPYLCLHVRDWYLNPLVEYCGPEQPISANTPTLIEQNITANYTVEQNQYLALHLHFNCSSAVTEQVSIYYNYTGQPANLEIHHPEPHEIASFIASWTQIENNYTIGPNSTVNVTRKWWITFNNTASEPKYLHYWFKPQIRVEYPNSNINGTIYVWNSTGHLWASDNASAGAPNVATSHPDNQIDWITEIVPGNTAINETLQRGILNAIRDNETLILNNSYRKQWNINLYHIFLPQVTLYNVSVWTNYSTYGIPDDFGFVVTLTNSSGTYDITNQITINTAEKTITMPPVNLNDPITFTVDAKNTTPPQIEFVPPTETSGSTINRNYIQVNVSAEDENLKNITIYLYDSNGLVNQATSTTSPYFVNFTNLPDGTYYFNATAWDEADNSNSTETRAIIIDTTAPQLTLNSPDDGLLTGNTTITFNCSAQDATNLANITLWINSSGWHANETQVVSGNSNSTTFIKTFEQGTYLWSCSACDEFGHCNYSFVENRTFTIDLNAPIINYVSPTDANNAYVARLWTFVNVTVSDANNVSACWLEWDGINESMTMQGSGQDVYCYINKSYDSDGEGQHSYNVYANDTLNNIAIAGERTITFDITPPTIENVSITSITRNSATIRWQTNEPSNSTINYGIDLNLSNNVTELNLVINHSIALTGLSAQTTYYFNITSCDAAGNCNTSGYYNFTTLAAPSGRGRAEERAEGEKPEEKPKEERVIEITRQLKEGYYERAIGKGDRLLFVFRYVTHYIVLENIGRDERGYYINISIHSTPLYDKLYEGQAKTYDINSDKRPDILIEFLGLNASSNSTLANVRVYLLECICPAPSNWSECREGKQSRVVYKCSEATDWTCVAEVEEKACEKKPPQPSIKKKINYLVLALIVALFVVLILLPVFLVKAIKQHRRQKFVSKIKFYKEKYM